jgi:uncharacterized protein YbaP (TraB family)
MRPARFAADRAADAAMWLVGLINLVVAVAFAVTLLAIAPARGQEAPACKGEDLMARLAGEAPDRLAAIRKEADAVENGQAMLWRIETDGAAASYLFGTMHMSDPRILALPDDVREALDTSATVVIETTDILDQSKMMAAMMAHPELMMFTDDTTLTGLLSAEDRAVVEAALAERGIPLASIQKMKPWMVAAMVALPACELARKAAGEPVLDAMLAAEASAAGKALGGLETVADQLGAMASLPMDMHLQGLVDTLKLGPMIDDVIETMIVLYLDGEPGMFWPFFKAALPADEGSVAGFAAFEEVMVTARNRTMAERAAPFIDQGGAFIAVGALHLPGPGGIVSLLEAAGYRMTAVE